LPGNLGEYHNIPRTCTDLCNLQLFPTFITIIDLFCTRRLLEIGSFKFLDHNFYCIHFASSCIWG
jgi:hypothetical protein